MLDSRHSNPDEILLLIEVADTTLGYDRRQKIPHYAAAGAAEVWLVDLEHERVLVYRAPCDGRYTPITTVGRGRVLQPLTFPDLKLSLADALGPPAAQP